MGTLESISLGMYYNTKGSVPGHVEKALVKLMCDTSSVESLCSSNHRLHCLNGGWRCRDESKISSVMEINYGQMQCRMFPSQLSKIREKLRKFYFRNEDFDVALFSDMDVALLPNIMELVNLTETRSYCTDNGTGRYLVQRKPTNNLNALYRILRNCQVSTLFSFPPVEKLLQTKEERTRESTTNSSGLK